MGALDDGTWHMVLAMVCFVDISVIVDDRAAAAVDDDDDDDDAADDAAEEEDVVDAEAVSMGI